MSEDDYWNAATDTDRHALYMRALDEIARQQALNKDLVRRLIEKDNEIERLRGMVAEDTGTWQDLWKLERATNERLQSEIERLRADNEWLILHEAKVSAEMSVDQRLLDQFRDAAKTVRLNCGPRPGGKSEEWRRGQDIGLRQGLKIAETILEALLAEGR